MLALVFGVAAFGAGAAPAVGNGVPQRCHTDSGFCRYPTAIVAQSHWELTMTIVGSTTYVARLTEDGRATFVRAPQPGRSCADGTDECGYKVSSGTVNWTYNDPSCSRSGTWTVAGGGVLTDDSTNGSDQLAAWGHSGPAVRCGEQDYFSSFCCAIKSPTWVPGRKSVSGSISNTTQQSNATLAYKETTHLAFQYGPCDSCCPRGARSTTAAEVGGPPNGGPPCWTINFAPQPAASTLPTVKRRSGYPALQPHVDPELLTVLVRENGHVPTQTVEVRVTDTSSNGNSGHLVHAGTRPHGWLADTAHRPQNTVVANTAIGGSQDTGGLTLQTDGDGEAQFYWLPPEISGIERLTATIQGHQATPAASDVTVQDGDWQQLQPDNALYRLVGETNSHQANHAGTAATLGDLRTAAQDYINRQNHDPQLLVAIQQLTALGYDFNGNMFPQGFPDHMVINDISLPWGGLFDTGHNWHPPHAGHRWGNQVDLRTNYLVTDPRHPAGIADPTPQFAVLVQAVHLRLFQLLEQSLRAAGGNILYEGGQVIAGVQIFAHLHVTF